jgi:cytochrome b561
MLQYAKYNAVAISLHWLVVLLVILQFILGWTMPDVHRDTKPISLIAAHIIVGTALLTAMVCRVIWRLTHQPPSEDLSPVLRAVSAITHFALYALLIVVPVLGWITASSRGWTVTLLGVVPLPGLSPVGSGWGHEMGDVHGVLAWVLFGGICLHVAAALFHRFVLRDGVLRRMLPW